MRKAITHRCRPREERQPTVLMLLTNAYDPDPRVRQEALVLLSMGCRVSILAWDRDLKSPAWEEIEGVEVTRVHLRSTHGRGAMQAFFYLALYLEMFWRGLRMSSDVLHCHDLDTLPVGVALGKLKRRPVVYDAHESFTDMLQGSVNPGILKWIFRLEGFLLRRIDLLVTVGERLRDHFARRGARRSVVVGNWKNLSDFSRTPEDCDRIREGLGIPEQATVIVCITQLLKDRKLEELLGAVECSEGAHLIVGGKGVLEDRVREGAARNSRIHYVGYVGPKDIADYTCAADVVYYGFDPDNPNARFSAPNKLFEALAAGRPLITGDFGEIAEIVRRFECGIVVPEYTVANVASALALMQDRAKRSTMAANAARAGGSFLNWEQGKRTLYVEYSALLPGRLTAPPPVESPAAMAVG
jgi:glycosyltransferase involved in cell wall biosynthesis